MESAQPTGRAGSIRRPGWPWLPSPRWRPGLGPRAVPRPDLWAACAAPARRHAPGGPCPPAQSAPAVAASRHLARSPAAAARPLPVRWPPGFPWLPRAPTAKDRPTARPGSVPATLGPARRWCPDPAPGSSRRGKTRRSAGRRCNPDERPGRRKCRRARGFVRPFVRAAARWPIVCRQCRSRRLPAGLRATRSMGFVWLSAWLILLCSSDGERPAPKNVQSAGSRKAARRWPRLFPTAG